MTEAKNHSYCKGLLCNRWDRKNQCVECGIWVCGGMCSIGTGKNLRCMTCYLKTFNAFDDEQAIKKDKKLDNVMFLEKKEEINKNELPQII